MCQAQDHKESNYLICPVCGDEADTFYVSAEKEIVGCSNCVEKRDAWEIITDEEDYEEGYD